MILIANKEGTTGVQKAYENLKSEKDSLRSIIEGIKLVESDINIHTVGKNSWPDLLGEVTLDASVMDGDKILTGAVGALVGYEHPVEVAYQIMQQLDHQILVGEGANRFAKEIGAKKCQFLTDQAKETWWQNLKKCLDEIQQEKFPDIRLLDISKQAQDPEKVFDTTVYLAKDARQKISSATSTSGWAWKYPGRLGDSPIIGAGSYADSRYGACACTHTGEMTIRTSTARSVVLYMKMGLSVENAVLEAVNDLKALKYGFIGEVTIHAIDNNDNYKVVSYRGSEPVYYWVWKDAMTKPKLQRAEYVE